MTRRPIAAIALVIVLVLAGCTVGYQQTSGVTHGPDEEVDERLGYYDGYWYNDTFDIDPEAGLTEDEAEAVFARSMARVQLLRGLRFEDDVDIEVITREEFREEFDDVWHEPPDELRKLDNAQHEALFLVGPDRDVVDVRRNNRGGTVLGFYQSGTERIVIVSANDPATIDDEITLAHELLHALQDQHFGLASDAETLDAINARNGLIEGDAVVIERAYERSCETGEWECVDVGAESSSTLPPDFHWGVYFLGFFPYAEGPSFVEHHYERGGWHAVNQMYDTQPTKSAEIIRPETYGSDVYGEAIVRDRTTADWEQVTVEDGPGSASVGQAGLATMFAYTAYEGDSPGVIGQNDFRNVNQGGVDSNRPYTYDVPYTEGWYGDQLHVYENDGEVAYVWNVTFNDAANATAFHDGYEQVAAHWHGERRGGVWTFEESDRFHGTVWTERDDNAVTVVKAPSEDALDEVHAPVSTPIPAAAD